MKFISILFLLFSTTASANLEVDHSLNLGIAFAPSFTPEGGYKNSNLRLGVEAGVFFFKYRTDSVLDIDGLNPYRKTSFKLLKVGLGAINNKPVVTFSPLAVKFQDRLYLSPTFGFGKDPYTMFTIAYELLP